ncbi:MAG: hypothetical protein H6551_07500 [Chitinophagales bacterium]|nr:hypothetical protein [Chitinophagales bacterium]
MSTNSQNHPSKKLDKYIVLVLSFSIILSVIIWVWYDAKLERIKEQLNNEKSEYILQK